MAQIFEHFITFPFGGALFNVGVGWLVLGSWGRGAAALGTAAVAFLLLARSHRGGSLTGPKSGSYIATP